MPKYDLKLSIIVMIELGTVGNDGEMMYLVCNWHLVLNGSHFILGVEPAFNKQ